MGDHYSLLIPGFGGPGNDLRLVLSKAAGLEVLKDFQKIMQASTVQNKSTHGTSKN